jgi:hypothetical protein
MKKILLSLILTIGFASPAVAEEVVQEEVGGWAVVNPETNQVHGVIVCTESVCGSTGSWGGVLPGEYMGCTNCNLKFQTKATDDGNVAGWHGENVTYKPEDETFEMTNNYSTDNGDVEQVMVVTPSQTASDGKDLYTGVQTKTKLKTKAVNNQTVVVELTKESSQDVVVPVKVQYEQWNGGTSFFYESVDQLQSNIDADVESVFTPCETCNADPEQVEEYRNAFYETVTTLTTKVKDFIASLFGGI